MRKIKQLMTDAEIRAIAENESDEQYWDRMFFTDIAQRVSDENDAEWRANGRCSDEK